MFFEFMYTISSKGVFRSLTLWVVSGIKSDVIGAFGWSFFNIFLYWKVSWKQLIENR